MDPLFGVLPTDEPWCGGALTPGMVARFDLDDILGAIAGEIAAARAEGQPSDRVFPRYFYVNTRVWEDEIAPHAAQLLADMQIEVRHHRLMPVDQFALTRDPFPALDVAKYHQGGGVMPPSA